MLFFITLEGHLVFVLKDLRKNIPIDCQAERGRCVAAGIARDVNNTPVCEAVADSAAALLATLELGGRLVAALPFHLQGTRRAVK